LTFEQLEDKINKWVHELSHQESLFLDQATKVNAWGLLVNENLDKLTDLDNAVKRVEGDQKAIDRELDLVVCMQQELKEMIDPLESDVDRQLEAQANRINLNSDRERMLNLTDMLDQQMFESADDLRSIIEQINQQKCDNKESSSITKISAILSNHIDTLNWVSSQTGSLDSKLEELRRNISALTMMN
jgi:chromosome segregation ATPase